MLSAWPKESIVRPDDGEEKEIPGGGSPSTFLLATRAELADAELLRKKAGTQKAWREKNKTYLKEYMKRWWEKNPEKKRAYKYANRKRVKTRELVDLMMRQHAACALCGERLEDRHLDHIVPKSRGGLEEIGNYQWLCPPCNMAKSSFTNEEFIAHIRKILLRVGG